MNNNAARLLWPTAVAVNADHVYNVVTTAGSEAGTAAATSGGWLGELLAAF